MKNFEGIASKIFTALLGALLVLGVTLVEATWFPPTVAPPNSDIAAPLNTGDDTQVKGGGFGVFGRMTVAGGGSPRPRTPGWFGASDFSFWTGRKAAAEDFCLNTPDPTGFDAKCLSKMFEPVFLTMEHRGAPTDVADLDRVVRWAVEGNGSQLKIGTYGSPGTMLPAYINFPASVTLSGTYYLNCNSGVICFTLIGGPGQLLVFRNGAVVGKITLTGAKADGAISVFYGSAHKTILGVIGNKIYTSQKTISTFSPSTTFFGGVLSFSP